MTAALLGASLLSDTAGASVVGLAGVGGTFSASVLADSVARVLGSSLLSGLLTGASAFSSVQAGNMQAGLMNLQGQEADLNARMETLKGRQQALLIKNNLDKDLASQNAIFASRGLLAGEGSAEAAAEESKKNAEEDINVANFGAEMGSESDKLRAAQYRIEAKAARKTGVTDAIGTITNSRSLRNASNSLLSNL